MVARSGRLFHTRSVHAACASAVSIAGGSTNRLSYSLYSDATLPTARLIRIAIWPAAREAYHAGSRCLLESAQQFAFVCGKEEKPTRAARELAALCMRSLKAARG